MISFVATFALIFSINGEGLSTTYFENKNLCETALTEVKQAFKKYYNYGVCVQVSQLR